MFNKIKNLLNDWNKTYDELQKCDIRNEYDDAMIYGQSETLSECIYELTELIKLEEEKISKNLEDKNEIWSRNF